jgi:hypothetical protein
MSEGFNHLHEAATRLALLLATSAFAANKGNKGFA